MEVAEVPQVQTPSARQLAVYHAVQHEQGNVAVLATAGSGKTTTIVHASRLIPRYKKTLFLSFSKAIVEELKRRLPGNVLASTLHSKGMQMMRKFYPGRFIQVDKDKYWKLAIGAYRKRMGENYVMQKKDFSACKKIDQVCAFARMTRVPFVDDDLKQMANFYSIEWDNLTIELAKELLADSLKVPAKKFIIDFTDMIYFPVSKPQMIDEKYDVIFLDEAQDTNKCQFEFIEQLLNKNGRLISVGDDFQCIYGFSGADVDAFKRIRERPNTTILPLSISYRCSKAVVGRAKEVNPDIEHHDGAHEGTVRIGGIDEIEVGDMVLSRTTKPLIELYFYLLEAGTRAKVMGKDFEEGLIEFTEKVMAPHYEGIDVNVQLMLAKVTTELREHGVRKIKDHFKYRAITDKYEILQVIMRKVNSTSEIGPAIHEMFADDDRPRVRLMTIHRSKGLEEERVFLIETHEGNQLMPNKWATQPWELKQETNMLFVALTRAKKELITLHLKNL